MPKRRNHPEKVLGENFTKEVNANVRNASDGAIRVWKSSVKQDTCLTKYQANMSNEKFKSLFWTYNGEFMVGGIQEKVNL